MDQTTSKAAIQLPPHQFTTVIPVKRIWQNGGDDIWVPPIGYKVCVRCFREEWADGQVEPGEAGLCQPSFKEMMTSLGKQFTNAWQAIADALTPAIERALGAFKLLWPYAQMLRDSQLMDEFGRNNDDEDGMWQSDMCAVWLHGECSSKVSHLCKCRCHK